MSPFRPGIMGILPVEGVPTAEKIGEDQLSSLQLGVGNGKAGCFVERVSLSSQFDMWVDEEGMLKQLPFNIRASIIAGQPILGTAVITNKGDIE